LKDIFLAVVNMSITASWLVLAVVLLRLFMKKPPKWIRLVLWAMVAFRLICPFTLESAVSVIPSANTITTVTDENLSEDTGSRVVIHSGIQNIDDAVNPVVSRFSERPQVTVPDKTVPAVTFETDPPVTGKPGTNVPDGTKPVDPEKNDDSSKPSPEALYAKSPVEIFLDVSGIVWLSGAVLLALYAAASYLRLRYRVRGSVRDESGAYVCGAVSTPFILGIFSPRIYVPSNISGDAKKHVLAHETAHIKRKDHLWKPLGFLILAVYWFNPLTWLAYVLFCKDVELACDEKVIRKLGRDDIASYSQTLLDLSSPRRLISACPLAFGEVSVKERVRRMLNYKKPAVWIVAVAITACMILAGCMMTDPLAKSDKYPDTVSIEIPDGAVSASVTTVNETYPDQHREYDFDYPEKAKKLADYFTRFTLSPDVDANSAVLEAGLLYRTSFIYGDGTSRTVLYRSDYSDIFIKWDGKWYLIVPRIDADLSTFLMELNNNAEYVPGDRDVNVLRKAVPEYFGLQKPFEIYVCQFAKGSYSCVITTEIAKRHKLLSEVTALRSISVSEMKKVLGSYNSSDYTLPSGKVKIIPFVHPASSYKYDVNDDYAAEISRLFDGKYEVVTDYEFLPDEDAVTASDLIKSGVTGVKIWSLPEHEDFTSPETISAVLDYFGKLKLVAEGETHEDIKNPVIGGFNRFFTFRYEDGSETTLGVYDADGYLSVFDNNVEKVLYKILTPRSAYDYDVSKLKTTLRAIDQASVVTDRSASELRRQIPEYFTIYDPVEVYVSHAADGSYFCGMVRATAYPKTETNIRSLPRVSIPEMKKILSEFHTHRNCTDDKVKIYAFKDPYSVYDYEIDDEYISSLSAMFDNRYETVRYSKQYGYDEEALDVIAENLKANRPELFRLDTSKGLVIYTFQMAYGDVSCRLCEGPKETVTISDLANVPILTVESVKALLRSYGIPDGNVVIVPYHNPVSSYRITIDEEYLEQIELIFENRYDAIYFDVPWRSDDPSVIQAKLKASFPEYFGLDASNGLVVYQCQFSDIDFRFTISDKAIGSLTKYEIMSQNLISSSTLTDILETYGLPNDKITVVPISIVTTSGYTYTVDGEYAKKIAEMLGNRYNVVVKDVPGKKDGSALSAKDYTCINRNKMYEKYTAEINGYLLGFTAEVRGGEIYTVLTAKDLNTGKTYRVNDSITAYGQFRDLIKNGSGIVVVFTNISGGALVFESYDTAKGKLLYDTVYLLSETYMTGNNGELYTVADGAVYDLAGNVLARFDLTAAAGRRPISSVLSGDKSGFVLTNVYTSSEGTETLTFRSVPAGSGPASLGDNGFPEGASVTEADGYAAASVMRASDGNYVLYVKDLSSGTMKAFEAYKNPMPDICDIFVLDKTTVIVAGKDESGSVTTYDLYFFDNEQEKICGTLGSSKATDFLYDEKNGEFYYLSDGIVNDSGRIPIAVFENRSVVSTLERTGGSSFSGKTADGKKENSTPYLEFVNKSLERFTKELGNYRLSLKQTSVYGDYTIYAENLTTGVKTAYAGIESPGSFTDLYVHDNKIIFVIFVMGSVKERLAVFDINTSKLLGYYAITSYTRVVNGEVYFIESTESKVLDSDGNAVAEFDLSGYYSSEYLTGPRYTGVFDLNLESDGTFSGRLFRVLKDTGDEFYTDVRSSKIAAVSPEEAAARLASLPDELPVYVNKYPVSQGGAVYEITSETINGLKSELRSFLISVYGEDAVKDADIKTISDKEIDSVGAVVNGISFRNHSRNLSFALSGHSIDTDAGREKIKSAAFSDPLLKKAIEFAGISSDDVTFSYVQIGHGYPDEFVIRGKADDPAKDLLNETFLGIRISSGSDDTVIVRIVKPQSPEVHSTRDTLSLEEVKEYFDREYGNGYKKFDLNGAISTARIAYESYWRQPDYVIPYLLIPDPNVSTETFIYLPLVDVSDLKRFH